MFVTILFPLKNNVFYYSFFFGIITRLDLFRVLAWKDKEKDIKEFIFTSWILHDIDLSPVVSHITIYKNCWKISELQNMGNTDLNVFFLLVLTQLLLHVFVI